MDVKAAPPVPPPLEILSQAEPPHARRAFAEVMDMVSEAQPIQPPPPRRQVNPAETLLQDSFRSEDHLNAMILAAQRGKTFSASELIALQAEAFRHSQVVEVVSRTIDRVLGGVKQVLGTQV